MGAEEVPVEDKLPLGSGSPMFADEEVEGEVQGGEEGEGAGEEGVGVGSETKS